MKLVQPSQTPFNLTWEIKEAAFNLLEAIYSPKHSAESTSDTNQSAAIKEWVRGKHAIAEESDFIIKTENHYTESIYKWPPKLRTLLSWRLMHTL